MEKTTTAPIIDLYGDIDKQALSTVDNFAIEAFQVVTSTPIFSENEKKELLIATENMENAFFHSQIFRTDTEARVSVLNNQKHPTIASKYYQCLREMNVHQCELINLLCRHETKREDLKIIQADIMELEDKLTHNSVKEWEILRTQAEINKKYILLKQHSFDLKNMKREADDRKREILMWDTLLKELEPEMKRQEIPTDDPNAHQLISYAIRFIKQCITTFSTKETTMNVGEIQNIVGLLSTTIKKVREDGKMPLLVKHLENTERRFLFANGIPIDELGFEEKEKQELLEEVRENERKQKVLQFRQRKEENRG
jgi:hypothetical protein